MSPAIVNQAAQIPDAWKRENNEMIPAILQFSV